MRHLHALLPHPYALAPSIPYSTLGFSPYPALPTTKHRLVLSKSALHAFPVNANANLMHADLRGVDSLGVVFQK